MTDAAPLPKTLPGLRPLSPREDMLRQAAAACAVSRTPNCNMTVHAGFFFDGTNNNKKRDKDDVLVPKDKDGQPLRGIKGDPNRCSHTNVAVLHDAYRDEPENGYYKFYLPGVGTAFPEIGEFSESDEGKAYGKGGDARINWAMLQLINAIHRTVYKRLLLEEAEAHHAATSWPMHVDGIDANLNGKLKYLLHGASADASRRTPEIVPLLKRLKKALALKPKPAVALINVSVFGFSRGAAQARAFCGLLQALLHIDNSGSIARLRGKENPSYSLIDIPLRIQFVGLFDSVASAGLADASPFWRGFGGWANGMMDIPASVERTVHFVAAHEIRRAFPLSSVRTGGSMPRNCLEVVYPGAHSDVGGGYPAGSQGKATGGRTALVSQVPLVEMYMEAIKSGVPLLSVKELAESETNRAVLNDLQIDPVTAQLFNHYARWAAPAADVTEAMLHRHVRHYWRWRRQRGAEAFQTLYSVRHAPPQDRQDLLESEKDFQEDHARLQAALELMQSGKAGSQTVDDPAGADYLVDMRSAAAPVPREVDAFFDTLIHDSHATFYMCGPTTDLDRQKLAETILHKKQSGATLSRLEQRIVDSGGTWPVLTDADTDDLLNLMAWYAKGALKAARQKTRRENDGHIHYRRVFDKS